MQNSVHKGLWYVFAQTGLEWSTSWLAWGTWDFGTVDVQYQVGVRLLVTLGLWTEKF